MKPLKAVWPAFYAMVAASGGALALPEKSNRTPTKHVQLHGSAARMPSRAKDFRVSEWVSFETARPADLWQRKLDLTVAPDNDVEEITVIGKRHRDFEQESPNPNSPLAFGPATVTGTTTSEQAGFSGLKVTTAIPVTGVPGLDAVLNVSGGYDQLNESTTKSSAAATVGLRLKF